MEIFLFFLISKFRSYQLNQSLEGGTQILCFFEVPPSDSNVQTSLGTIELGFIHTVEYNLAVEVGIFNIY